MLCVLRMYHFQLLAKMARRLGGPFTIQDMEDEIAPDESDPDLERRRQERRARAATQQAEYQAKRARKENAETAKASTVAAKRPRYPAIDLFAERSQNENMMLTGMAQEGYVFNPNNFHLEHQSLYSGGPLPHRKFRAAPNGSIFPIRGDPSMPTPPGLQIVKGWKIGKHGQLLGPSHLDRPLLEDVMDHYTHAPQQAQSPWAGLHQPTSLWSLPGENASRPTAPSASPVSSPWHPLARTTHVSPMQPTQDPAVPTTISAPIHHEPAATTQSRMHAPPLPAPFPFGPRPTSTQLHAPPLPAPFPFGPPRTNTQAHNTTTRPTPVPTPTTRPEVVTLSDDEPDEDDDVQIVPAPPKPAIATVNVEDDGPINHQERPWHNADRFPTYESMMEALRKEPDRLHVWPNLTGSYLDDFKTAMAERVRLRQGSQEEKEDSDFE